MKIFLSYSSGGRELAGELIRRLAEGGHQVVDPQYPRKGGSNLLKALPAEVLSSDVMICLITERSSNVYFEAGLAAGGLVPILVAATDVDSLVAGLSSTPYVQLAGDVSTDAAEILHRVGEVAEVPEQSVARSKQAAELSLVAAAEDPSALASLDPAAFERLVADLLRERGYQVESGAQSLDRGFDFLVTDGSPTVVEVKRYSPGNLVSVGVVRQLLGSMVAAGAERGILISSSGFTKSAMAAAAEWPVDLMTIDDLLQLPPADSGSSTEAKPSSR
jgi:HJR/Mrr/RecB family endonuclease